MTHKTRASNICQARPLLSLLLPVLLLKMQLLRRHRLAARKGLTVVRFSAQPELFLTQNTP